MYCLLGNLKNLKLVIKMEEEIWKSVMGHEGYEISSHGRMLSHWKPKGKGYQIVAEHIKYLKPFLTSNGYLFYQLKGGKHISIHRTLGIHFLDCPENYQNLMVDHIDMNKVNNSLTNLRWVSRSQNAFNTNLRKTNTSGYKRIRFRRGHIEASRINNGKVEYKCFKILEEAINFTNINNK
jgi:hypothetical protein